VGFSHAAGWLYLRGTRAVRPQRSLRPSDSRIVALLSFRAIGTSQVSEWRSRVRDTLATSIVETTPRVDQVGHRLVCARTR